MTASIEESVRLIQSGELAQGLAMAKTLEYHPEHRADALHLLGVAAAHEGDAQRALNFLQNAVSADPDNMDRKLNYGTVALELGEVDRAINELSQVANTLKTDPTALTLLGTALSKAKRFEEAIDAHEKAINLFPNQASLWSHLASTYLAWGKLEAADAGNAYAVQLNPSSAELHFNLGGTQVLSGRETSAIECFRRALDLDPDHARARTSLGVMLRTQGKLEEGLQEQERAYISDPIDIDVRWNLAISHLFHGFWASGWKHYEARRERHPQLGREGFGRKWDGSAQPHETLVVEREQGYGDTFMFARFLDAASERVGRLVFRSPARLCPLLKEGLRAQNIEIAPFELEPYPGLYAPLMSLPHLLSVGSDIRSEPYLQVAHQRVADWGKQLGARSQKPRVGLAWQGNPEFPADKHRSIPLAALRELLALENVEIISLQQIDGLDQIDQCPPELRPRILERPVDAEGAFLDTAAIMKNLDLMVTIDSAPAHLAGSLGIPTAILLHQIPDWRWGQGPEIWYPNMRSFQQRSFGDWGPPIAELTEYVSKMPSSAAC